MKTEEQFLVWGLQALDQQLGKHLDQTKSALTHLPDDTDYRKEYANRIEVRNYIQQLITEIESSGFAITDTKVFHNERLLTTMEEM